MATIKVLAGDFLEGDGSYTWGSFTLKTIKHDFLGETISANQIDTVDIATEENIKKIGGTVGWGIAGAAILGPVGLLAGLLLGGKKKEIVFVVKFKDNRKLLASTDSATYKKIQAITFNRPSNQTESLPISEKPELNNSNNLEKLIKLNDMLDKSLITEDEFKKFKKQLDEEKLESAEEIEQIQSPDQQKNDLKNMSFVESKNYINSVYNKLGYNHITVDKPSSWMIQNNNIQSSYIHITEKNLSIKVQYFKIKITNNSKPHTWNIEYTYKA